MINLKEAFGIIITVVAYTFIVAQFGDGFHTSSEREPASAKYQPIGGREFKLDPSKAAVQIKVKPLYTSSPDTGTVEKYLVNAKEAGVLEHWQLESAATGEQIYCAEISSDPVKPGVFTELQNIHTDILITDLEVTSVRNCSSAIGGVAGL